jgi:hypothetical protein
MLSFKTWFLNEVGDGGISEPRQQLPHLFYKANPGEIKPSDFPNKGPKTATSKYAITNNPNKGANRPEPNLGLGKQA